MLKYSFAGAQYDLDKLRYYARYHYRFMVDEEEQYVKKGGESHEL
jgi:hypothetical protein